MKKIGIIIIIAAVAIIGGFFLYTTYAQSDGTIEFEAADGSVGGELSVALKLNYEDGTSQTISGYDPFNTQSIHYNGQEVTSVTWQLYGTATTPSTNDPYDYCVVNYAYAAQEQSDDFYLYITLAEDIDEDLIPDVAQGEPNAERWYNTICPVNYGPVQAVLLPIDDGIQHLIWEYTVYFDDFFDGDEQAGGYVLIFEPSGESSYYGEMADGEQGRDNFFNWDDANGMDATFPLTHVSRRVSLSFSTDVIFS